ncbi:MAG TPA: glycosyltransferase [Candidatus Limnocylindrales bacterium]|nr:glycosyltransferase [Candidatus Limnocylindrales bacterium]
MEIVFIGTLEPFPGGSGTVNGQVVRGLTQRGHSITAVSPLGPLAGARAAVPSPADDDARFPGARIRRYDVPFAEVEPHRTDQAFIDREREAIATTLLELAPAVPDVVLVGRETFARHVPEALPWAEKLPVVVAAHSSDAHGALSGNRHPTAAENLLARIAACTRLVLVAHHQRASYEVLGVPITVVPNGVDLVAFHPAVSGDRRAGAQEDIVFIHASNLKDAKRPLDLVAAAALALRSEPRLYFLIAGDGPLAEPMRQAARNASIEHRFAFTGWHPRAEMPDMFRQADVAVLMSGHESMPCALLEGMASGLPTIATDIPASREALIDGETGFLYPAGEVERLASLMVDLAAHSSRRTRAGRAARVAVENRGVETMVTGYESVLSFVVAESARDRRSTVAGGH